MDYLVYLQILVSVILFVMVIKRYRDNRRPPQSQTAAPAASADSKLLNPEAAQDPDRSWSQKLPLPSPAKPWWRLYVGTLVILLCGVAQTSHNAWFVYSNPPPVFEALQVQRVEVLGWQRTHPQLHVRLADGKSGMLEFPTLRLGKGGDLYLVLSFDEQRQLVGQTCQVWGRPLRFSIQDSYQVFALECDQGGRLLFDKAIDDYKKSFRNRTSSTSFSVGIFVWLFGVVITFWAETVRNRKDLLALQVPSTSISSPKAQR